VIETDETRQLASLEDLEKPLVCTKVQALGFTPSDQGQT